MKMAVLFDLREGGWADLINPDPNSTSPFKDTVEWLPGDRCNMSIGRLPREVTPGSASVLLRADRPDGSVVLLEMSLKCLLESVFTLEKLEVSEAAAAEALSRASRR